MTTPHKHAAIIKAWADGAEIEYLDTLCMEPIWREATRPSWSFATEYRVKPAPIPDHVYYGVFDGVGNVNLDNCFTKFNDSGDHIKVVFDGKTRKLKSVEILT